MKVEQEKENEVVISHQMTFNKSNITLRKKL